MTINVGDRVEITEVRPQWGRRLQRMERVVRVEITISEVAQEGEGFVWHWRR